MHIMTKKTKSETKVKPEAKEKTEEQPAIAPAEAKKEDTGAKGKKKVLVIEDDSMLSSMYRMKLEDSGYTAFVANEGKQGLETAKSEKPDLILLDIMMPMMDGFSVLAEIKEDASLKDVPVIIMTNLGTNEDIDKGKKMGAVDYVVKADSTPAQIVERIKKYL